MTAPNPRETPEPTWSPRLAALALLIAGAAAAGLTLHPGPALASGGGASQASPTSPVVGVTASLVRVADDDAPAEDPADDATSADDADVPVEDEATAEDDGSGPETDGAVDDEPITAVAIDRRGRLLEGPRTFAPSKNARGAQLRWTGWDTATATGRGKIVVRRTAGKGHRTVHGTGTILLTRLTTCEDGTPIYRRAVVSVGRKAPVRVTLPGCSALL